MFVDVFQDLFEMNLHSPMPDFLREVTTKPSHSCILPNSSISSFVESEILFCLCVCMFSACRNQVLQSYKCGVLLFPTWRPPPWARLFGHRHRGHSSVGVQPQQRSTLTWYTAKYFGQEIYGDIVGVELFFCFFLTGGFWKYCLNCLCDVKTTSPPWRVNTG